MTATENANGAASGASNGSSNSAQTGGVHDLALASLAIHADDGFSIHRAVAPAMHVSTTYRYSRNPEDLIPMENIDVRLSLRPLYPLTQSIPNRA